MPLPALLDELARKDWQTFDEIDVANQRRVVRAVEVIRLTGKPFSTQRAAWPERAALIFPSKFATANDAAELLAVCLADGREQHVFGRRTLPQMDLASASCAIQNLWLAARAEGLGMGWVSMFDPVAVAALLGMPDGAEPVAVLCIGPVQHFYEEPMLQRQRWAQRCALDNILFENAWGQPLGPREAVTG